MLCLCGVSVGGVGGLTVGMEGVWCGWDACLRQASFFEPRFIKQTGLISKTRPEKRGLMLPCTDHACRIHHLMFAKPIMTP